jgi:hypothetical protein
VLKKKPKTPQRPKTRRWFPQQGQKWLKLEPARLAPIGGLFFATCTMVLYLVRLLLGHDIEPQTVLIGVATTFLVSYAGTGFFVWYILRTAETELDQPVAKPTLERGLDLGGLHDLTHTGGHEPAESEELP